MARVLPRLLSLLDGSRNDEELRTQLPDLDGKDVDAVLDELDRWGLLVEAAGATASPPRLCLEGLRLFLARRLNVTRAEPDVETLLARLQDARVFLVAPRGSRDLADETARALASHEIQAELWEVDSAPPSAEEEPRAARIAGLPIRTVGIDRLEHELLLRFEKSEGETGPPANLLVVTTWDPWPRLLSVLNAVSIASRTALLPAGFEGQELTLGPLVIPGESACLACLDRRRHANEDHPEEWSSWQAHLDTTGGGVAAPGVGGWGKVAAGLVAIEALAHLTYVVPPATFGAQLVQDMALLESRRESVLRIPWCDACGSNARPSLGPSPLPLSASETKGSTR